MFCPKCASQSVEGQRFCRQCGTNLGIILDAMDGKRTPVDFDALKGDLRELGLSLRDSFQEVSQSFKKTQQLNPHLKGGPWAHGQRKNRKQINREIVERIKREIVERIKQKASGAAVPSVPSVPPVPFSTKPIPIKIKQVRGGSSRQHSLQQAALSIFSGGAMSGTLYYLLNAAGGSGLLHSLETLILQQSHLQITGLAPVFQALWVLGLVPVAKGFAHLLNGIFFAAKPTENPADVVVQEINQRIVAAQPPQTYVAPASAIPLAENPMPAPDTNEFKRERNFRPVASITEDPTERFATREPDSERVSR